MAAQTRAVGQEIVACKAARLHVAAGAVPNRKEPVPSVGLAAGQTGLTLSSFGPGDRTDGRIHSAALVLRCFSALSRRTLVHASKCRQASRSFRCSGRSIFVSAFAIGRPSAIGAVEAAERSAAAPSVGTIHG